MVCVCVCALAGRGVGRGEVRSASIYALRLFVCVCTSVCPCVPVSLCPALTLSLSHSLSLSLTFLLCSALHPLDAFARIVKPLTLNEKSVCAWVRVRWSEKTGTGDTRRTSSYFEFTLTNPFLEFLTLDLSPRRQMYLF
jgi:hypothetical protein